MFLQMALLALILVLKERVVLFQTEMNHSRLK